MIVEGTVANELDKMMITGKTEVVVNLLPKTQGRAQGRCCQ